MLSGMKHYSVQSIVLFWRTGSWKQRRLDQVWDEEVAEDNVRHGFQMSRKIVMSNVQKSKIFVGVWVCSIHEDDSPEGVCSECLL